MFNSPVTGAPITGLTSPTYTLTATSGPDSNAKAAIVTALGGTQTNVSTHSVDAPFSGWYQWPKVQKTMQALVGIVGRTVVPKNKSTMTFKKSMAVSDSAHDEGLVRIEVITPVGSSTFAPDQVRALLSAAAGSFYADADDVATLHIQGVTP